MGIRTCFVTFNKVILAIINVVVVIVGLATFVLGVAAKTTNTLFFDIVTNGTFDIPILLIIFGLVLAIVGIVGFIATICAHKFVSKIVLFIYAAFLVVIILVDIGGAIAALVEKNRIAATFNTSAHENFKQIGVGNDRFHSWDNIQTQFSCCGVDTYTDWFTVVWKNNCTGCVPASCCKDKNNCFIQPPSTDPASLYWPDGCAKYISDQVGGHIGAVAGVVIFIVFVLIAIVVITCLATFCKAESSYSRFDESK
jgi:hypothetical protein